MNRNPLFQLGPLGQSAWYDSIGRSMLRSGRLQQLIDAYAIVGVTSNPTIFEQALSASEDYDDEIRQLADAGLEPAAIFERLAVDDIRAACDLLLPISERTGGVDGRVSLEVSPRLAADAEGTLAEARRLWAQVARPNLMIKIPATPAGIAAVEQATAEGMSVNVTLLFAVTCYEQVIEAYLRGLERRAASGLPLDQIHSVASFFISRVDTAVDAELERRIARASEPATQAWLRGLRGQAAIANARVAYRAFQHAFDGPRWAALAARGANLQRPLWASTSTKNPAYPDTRYIAELVGSNTVNTIPESALLAFADHGEVRGATVPGDVAGAVALLHSLTTAGVDLAELTERRLVEEGVGAFASSYERLLAAIDARRELLRAS